MQRQPPQSNNPANPLFKVAALEIDRINLDPGPPLSARVQTSLNFKKSNDLRGYARTNQGDPVTCCFTLSIRRASFELRFSFPESRQRTGPKVSIRDVPFVSGLAIYKRISRNLEFNAERITELAASLSGKIDGDVKTLGVRGKGAGKARKAKMTKTRSKIRYRLDTRR